MTDIEKIRNTFFAVYACKNRMEILKAFFKGQEPTKVILNNGIQINSLEGPLSAVRLIFGNEVYNPRNLPIQKNDIVVDIGANVGIFTLYASCKTKNAIYAFEPYDENFEFLNKNIYLNNLDYIFTYRLAVTDKIGTAKLFLSETCEGHMLYDHVIKGKLENYIEVPATTLQEIMDNNGLHRIDFLKLDCEGQEGTILKSTPQTYLAKVKKIAMEFHDNLSVYKHNFIQRILDENDFFTNLIWNGKSSYGYIYAWKK